MTRIQPEDQENVQDTFEPLTAEEVAEAQKIAKKLKISGFEILTVGAQHLAEPTTIVRTTLI